MFNNNKYFNKNLEGIPKWLKNYKKGDSINFKEVFNSNTLYYPGAGYDYSPISLFNPTNMIHTYIYVDYLVKKEDIVRSFKDSFYKGYHLYDIKEISYSDLKINSWTSHYTLTQEDKIRIPEDTVSYGLIAIFDIDDINSNLCKRFAIIYLGSDGIAGYDALFQNYKEPLALVLQDHGFGCNYNYFGCGGAMNQIADIINKFPKFIMCGYDTANWPGYELLFERYELPDINRDRYLSIKKEEIK